MNTNLTKLVQSLFSILPIQRKQQLKMIRHANPNLVNSKPFQKTYNEFAKVVGDNARLEMWKKSCQDAYVAKRIAVNAKQGKHKFIHPSTPN